MEVLILVVVGAILVVNLVPHLAALSGGDSSLFPTDDHSGSWQPFDDDASLAPSGIGGAIGSGTGLTMMSDFGTGIGGSLSSSGLLSDDWFSDASSHSMVNPATGLPMVSGDMGGVDVGGNVFGSSSHDLFSHDSSFGSGCSSSSFDSFDSSCGSSSFDSFDSSCSSSSFDSFGSGCGSGFGSDW